MCSTVKFVLRISEVKFATSPIGETSLTKLTSLSKITSLARTGKFSCSREIKTKTHLERWVLSCAKGTMFLSLRVLATPFDIVSIVEIRVIS